MTLNAILFKLLKPVADHHLMINDFGYGDLSKYATAGAAKFPLMWVVLKNVRYYNKGFNYQLSIIFADIVSEDLSNMVDIQSDMIQIAADVAAKVNGIENDFIEVAREFNLTPFSERFVDILAGVVMDFTITSLKALNDCDFPQIN